MKRATFTLEINWFYNIAGARAVDREFHYNFGSNVGPFGSGRRLKGRGAPVGSILAKFQLERNRFVAKA